MRQHLSADGIRRNKINLPLGGTKWYVRRIDGGRNGETHGESAQEGRKEGRKGGRKEERNGKSATHRIEDTYACLPTACTLLPLPPPPSANPRDSHRPSSRYPPGYENTLRFPSKKTRDIRRGVEPFCSFERERTPSREQNDPRKNIIQSAINRAAEFPPGLAGHGHF